jgi:hypothetical protein
VSGLPIGIAAAAAVSILGMAALGGAVDVYVTAVKASAAGPSDAQLLEIRPRLRRLLGYRSFRIVQEERRTCAWQAQQAFVIPGGRALHVVPKAMRDETVVMRVQLLDGRRSLVDTDVRLQNRGVMLFGVDAPTGADRGALIIMIKAEE